MSYIFSKYYYIIIHVINIHNGYSSYFFLDNSKDFPFFRRCTIRAKTSLYVQAVTRFQRIFSLLLATAPLSPARCRARTWLTFCLYYKITLRVVFSPGLSWFYSLYSFLLLPSVFKNVIFISFLCYPSTYQFTYIRHNIYQASFTVHNLLSLQFQLYINSNISWHVLYYVNYNFYFSNYKRIIFIYITKTMFLVQHLLTCIHIS